MYSASIDHFYWEKQYPKSIFIMADVLKAITQSEFGIGNGLDTFVVRGRTESRGFEILGGPYFINASPSGFDTFKFISRSVDILNCAFKCYVFKPTTNVTDKPIQFFVDNLVQTYPGAIL